MNVAPSMPHASHEKRILPLSEVPLFGRSFEPAKGLWAGLKYRPDLGIIHATGIVARRVHLDEFTCHPRATITPGGDFLLLFPAGQMHYAWAKKERRGNVMLASRSIDQGRTWTEPTPAWESSCSQHAAIPFIPRGSRRIYVFGTEPRHDVYDGVENAAIGFRTSEDDGRTWSDVTLLCPTNAPDFRGMSAMRMCETEDGVWLLGSHAGHWSDGRVVTEQYLLRSEDQGATWTLIPGAPPSGWRTPGFSRMEEGRPIHLGGNRVLLMVRTPEGRLWEMRSDDSGRSWSAPRPTALSHPDAPPMLFHLADGKTLVAFHHNKRQAGSMTHQHRAELWVSQSRDEGVSWSEPRLVVANAAVPATLSGWGGSSPMVSYADLLVSGPNLHLFVDHQVRQVLHLAFRQQDLESFPTESQVLGYADSNNDQT